MRDLRLTMLVTALLALGLCSQSHAADTIGHAPARAGELCEYNATMVQTGSPGNAHLAPYDGVITSWSSRGFWTTPTFKVVRPGPSDTYTVLASDGPREYTGNGTTLETYPIRVPVRQGDTIAARIGAGHCAIADAGYSHGLDRFNRAVGETGSYSGLGSGQRVPVAATLERDRDADGFGDETQDQCPTNASTQGPCPLPTTLGRTFTPSSTTVTSGSAIPAAPADHRYVAPADGVITSWSYQANALVAGTAKLKTVRPLVGDSFQVVAESEPRTPVANVLNTFPTRVSVREGDRIGIGVNNLPVISSSVYDPDSSWFVGSDPAPGASATFTKSGRYTNVAALLEADADNDGFGDTSQDQCPTDASTQGPCPVVGPPDPGADDACEKARKKLATAKAKLKKLKQKEAPAKKVKAAKQKVKKAKAKVKKAC